MRHQNSVFHGILKHVPWGNFDRLVSAHGSDARVRRLSTKSQLVALLYAQLSGALSLREVEAGLESHSDRLYHLGASAVRRSTLADANAGRNSAVFLDLLALLIQRVHRGLRQELADTIYLIDSTSVRLNQRSASWARFSKGVFGAKAHVIYDADANCPIYAAITPSRVNDITAAHEMPIERGATYVFDLGYYEFKWWAQLHKAKCRVVTRFKSNTRLRAVKELPLPEGSEILSDRLGKLPERLAQYRKNPMSCQVREVRVKTPTGKVLRILSNDLKASAQEIADLYKRRWAIELFFRWIKQTLRITKFLGTSENAVQIQIAVALIAFILLRLAHETVKNIPSPLAFARLVRANLMHRRELTSLVRPHRPPPEYHAQLSLSWA